MPTTRAGLEAVLDRQGGNLLGRVRPDLDPATAGGAAGLSAIYGSVVGRAMLDQGLAVADFDSPADAELAGVAGLDLKRLIDVSGLLLLEFVLASWAYPDTVADTDNRQDLGKLRDSIEKTAARRRAELEREYGIGGGSLSAGVLDLGFAATLDPDTGRPR